MKRGDVGLTALWRLHAEICSRREIRDKSVYFYNNINTILEPKRRQSGASVVPIALPTSLENLTRKQFQELLNLDSTINNQVLEFYIPKKEIVSKDTVVTDMGLCRKFSVQAVFTRLFKNSVAREYKSVEGNSDVVRTQLLQKFKTPGDILYPQSIEMEGHKIKILHVRHITQLCGVAVRKGTDLQNLKNPWTHLNLPVFQADQVDLVELGDCAGVGLYPNLVASHKKYFAGPQMAGRDLEKRELDKIASKVEVLSIDSPNGSEPFLEVGYSTDTVIPQTDFYTEKGTMRSMNAGLQNISKFGLPPYLKKIMDVPDIVRSSLISNKFGALALQEEYWKVMILFATHKFRNRLHAHILPMTPAWKSYEIALMQSIRELSLYDAFMKPSHREVYKKKADDLLLKLNVYASLVNAECKTKISRDRSAMAISLIGSALDLPIYNDYYPVVMHYIRSDLDMYHTPVNVLGTATLDKEIIDQGNNIIKLAETIQQQNIDLFKQHAKEKSKFPTFREFSKRFRIIVLMETPLDDALIKTLKMSSKANLQFTTELETLQRLEQSIVISTKDVPTFKVFLYERKSKSIDIDAFLNKMKPQAVE